MVRYYFGQARTRAGADLAWMDYSFFLCYTKYRRCGVWNTALDLALALADIYTPSTMGCGLDVFDTGVQQYIIS
jgi:hypothetical protein